ncbi:MAG: zf-HC2 domain-containing protein [Pyrinomonadaceae bacterium]
MKHSENNEMDLLLRGLATRSSSVSNGGKGAPQDAAHLDADELNAFAERTVPPAARARYTAHLADCARCRKLVATLSAAAGLPIAEIKAEDREKISFWQRLPAFLSPAVLRFAVPALAMLAVITVGIITLRQQRSADFVAQNQEPATPQSVSKPQQEPVGATTSNTQSAPRSSPVPSPNATPVGAKPANPGEESAATDKVTPVDTTSGFLAKDAAKPEAGKADEAQPKFAPEPPAPLPAPAAAKPQAAVSAGANKNEAVAKQKEGAAGETVDRPARDKLQVAEDREVDASRSRKAATAGRGGAPSTAEARRSETEQKRADKDAEIREVAGRRFRRQGDAWIDIAYVATRPAMNVVRGSEQYRVLVADEPSIRTIAERLSGEVIVVWKSRAYRIR